MTFGFGVLRLSSEQFWMMTPREIFAALEGVYGRAREHIGRDALQTLMSHFPDIGKDIGNGG